MKLRIILSLALSLTALSSFGTALANHNAGNSGTWQFFQYQSPGIQYQYRYRNPNQVYPYQSDPRYGSDLYYQYYQRRDFYPNNQYQYQYQYPNNQYQYRRCPPRRRHHHWRRNQRY